jgi:shikimate dehydrogenase
MKRFAILGYPLGHTLSPKLHRLLAEQLGEQIEYSICAIPPEELEEHFEELFCMDGFNITIPYKVRLMEQLDRLDALLDRLDEIQTTYDVCETAVTRAVESIRL